MKNALRIISNTNCSNIRDEIKLRLFWRQFYNGQIKCGDRKNNKKLLHLHFLYKSYNYFKEWLGISGHMTKKVIAIGNRLMQDDGVALEVGERIREVLHEKNIEVIIGETDIDFCIQRIQPGDEVYIMDSTYYGIAPGSLTYSNLSDKRDKNYISSSMHGFNLLDMLFIYRKKISVIFIGIEIDSIEMEIGLSGALMSKFEDICTHVIKLIV